LKQGFYLFQDKAPQAP